MTTQRQVEGLKKPTPDPQDQGQDQSKGCAKSGSGSRPKDRVYFAVDSPGQHNDHPTVATGMNMARHQYTASALVHGHITAGQNGFGGALIQGYLPTSQDRPNGRGG